MKTADRITGVILLVLSVYGYIYSSKLKGDAGTLPKLIFIGLIISSIALFVFSFISKENEPLEKMNWKKWTVAVVGAIAYAALINVLGFYIATALYLVLTMFYFGVRNIKTLILVPVIFNLIIFVGFGMILGIRMPAPAFL